jgi:hypothetical protein
MLTETQGRARDASSRPALCGAKGNSPTGRRQWVENDYSQRALANRREITYYCFVAAEAVKWTHAVKASGASAD